MSDLSACLTFAAVTAGLLSVGLYLTATRVVGRPSGLPDPPTIRVPIVVFRLEDPCPLCGAIHRTTSGWAFCLLTADVDWELRQRSGAAREASRS